MIYFKSRLAAREFARRNRRYKFADLGGNAKRRWAVKFL